jgi:hypothetical protein
MYCPSCSTKANEGAKFCKSCGMNLNIISQALNGVVGVADPIRDREYKKARKQISDGIQGSAIGAALLVAAVLGYFLVSNNTAVNLVALVLALAGMVKLFRSIGGIVDAKVGPKLIEPSLQPRSTGGLPASLPATPVANANRVSQRLSAGPARVGNPDTRPVALDNVLPTPLNLPASPMDPPLRQMTGRVNREHSSPLRKPDKEEDLMSKLRN